MKDRCPICSYDFRNAIERNEEFQECPNCHVDLRMFEVETWQRKCKSCGADIWKEAYNDKMAGKEIEDCPFCFSDLKKTFDNKENSTCQLCGTSVDEVFIEGNITFVSKAIKSPGTERYGIIEQRTGNFNVNIKCKGCGSILNYDAKFNKHYLDLINRLQSTFRIGD